jgi:VIT1/CCC1 family predicted Fe2+/Mn2+ transporter
MNDHSTRRETIRGPWIWCAVAILVAIGTAAVIHRALALAGKGFDYHQVHRQVRPTLSADAAQDLRDYDRGFAAHPALTFLHIVPGGIFLVLAPLQFSAGIRARHIRFHRWSGRVIVAAALLAGLSGLLLAAPFAFTGAAASSAVIFFGVLFLVAVIRAFVAIRHRDVTRHREWMIRAFSIGIGIAVVRVVGSVLFVMTRAEPFEIIGLSFWIGWMLSLAAAELWIRHTRPAWSGLEGAPMRATES